MNMLLTLSHCHSLSGKKMDNFEEIQTLKELLGEDKLYRTVIVW